MCQRGEAQALRIEQWAKAVGVWIDGIDDSLAHVLGDSGPLPSAQAELLLHRDSPPQTPRLRGEICVLTCIGRDGWSQVQ